MLKKSMFAALFTAAILALSGCGGGNDAEPAATATVEEQAPAGASTPEQLAAYKANYKSARKAQVAAAGEWLQECMDGSEDTCRPSALFATFGQLADDLDSVPVPVEIVDEHTEFIAALRTLVADTSGIDDLPEDEADAVMEDADARFQSSGDKYDAALKELGLE